jgi:hypothetical protein
VLAGLQAGCARLGLSPRSYCDDVPRKVSADALGNVEGKPHRLGYPGERQLGLEGDQQRGGRKPDRALEMNHRMHGTEPFWKEGGTDAMLKVRAA